MGGATALAERLRVAIEEEAHFTGVPTVRITASFGVVTGDGKEESVLGDRATSSGPGSELTLSDRGDRSEYDSKSDYPIADANIEQSVQGDAGERWNPDRFQRAADELVQRADRELYHAENRGKNRISVERTSGSVWQ